ncbi:hypothetical protein OB236_23920 [Paenibacillus sp. WQ 127069]|uniref:Restriction endonuclease n=1 Tax=Paenibacillus baimaensis TaxID=2982185 RepID=A0ABT2UNC1_9BACL|nr:hypothetical protein [Paenibacillus sp. WQ 127069]MCU6795159.1 hypothetical protein [Paenibacillus sp. WQ 127069]
MDTISYNQFINNAPDHFIWKPITEPERQHFLSLVEATKIALTQGTRQQKGLTLENLMTYVYQRFSNIAEVKSNITQGDNQFDHIIDFFDTLVPPFIYNYLGLRMVGESKNHAESISVREVVDLDELLRSKRCKVGVFSSYKSFSRGRNGSPWQYAEGKRRKLLLARNTIIIGFTISEIESLIENNFYTMLKQKFFNIVDEIDDDYDEESLGVTYHQRLYYSLSQLHKNGIIEENTYNESKQILMEKYGDIKED